MAHKVKTRSTEDKAKARARLNKNQVERYNKLIAEQPNSSHVKKWVIIRDSFMTNGAKK